MLKVKTWDDMNFWNTGEWDVIQERLDDLDKLRKQGDDGGWYNPTRSNLFAALDQTPLSQVKVAIFGQDPYPDARYATGVAFSIPEGFKPKDFPPTLVNIFKEYSDDLHLSSPSSGDLTPWCERGVFLWNVTPLYRKETVNNPKDWPEWWDLNQEIIEVLNAQSVVFVFLGARAREYAAQVDTSRNNRIIETSHPSPLGSLSGRNPFLGSRIFSRINGYLSEINNDTIDWRLPGSRTLHKK